MKRADVWIRNFEYSAEKDGKQLEQTVKSTCLVDNENDLDNQLDDSSAGLSFKLFENGHFNENSDTSERCVLSPFGQSGYSNLKRTLNKSFGKVIADSVVKRSVEEVSENDTDIEDTCSKKKGAEKKKCRKDKRTERNETKEKAEDEKKNKRKKDKRKKDKRNEFVDELMKVFQSSDRRIDILEEKIHRQTLEIGPVSN